ncbi:cathelicidin-2-like [Sminthopsis crassicaudata]|uniref:cathelicidin-2-like n=1 Tax=Sminthopsis crassicaudata TaxID=9301 RepID=UPI003D6854F9
MLEIFQKAPLPIWTGIRQGERKRYLPHSLPSSGLKKTILEAGTHLDPQPRRIRMESLRRSLLVLCVAVTITITSTLSVQQKKKLSDQEARSLLQATYNKESHDNFIYKILEIKHVSNQTERQIVRFTIQETRCLKLENRYPDQCEFKDDGLVKDCLGQISFVPFHRAFLFSCNIVDEQIILTF